MTFSKTDTKAAKGVAIMLMLYHHLFTFPDRIAEDITWFSTFSVSGEPIAYWIGYFGKLCVALFIFLSGYGTYLSCKNSDNVPAVITAKLKSLYFSFWKVLAIFVPICRFFRVESFMSPLKGLLWNISGLKTGYCGEWWFLPPFIVLLFLYPTLHSAIDRSSNIYSDALKILLIKVLASNILPTIYSYDWASKLSSSLFWLLLEDALALLPSFLMGCLFAKYDLLSRLKTRFSGKLVYNLAAAVLLLLIFYMRKHTGNGFDYLYAPAFTAALIIALECRPGKYIHLLLEKVGEESTTIWLIHSLYCYSLCQHLIYLPRYSPLIFLWLLLICYLTSILMKKFFGLLSRKVFCRIF